MRSTPTHSRAYPREELFNALTHGVGAVGSLAAGVILITMASLLGTVWQIVGAAVFAGSMLLLYSASTLYHGVTRLRLKARLRVLDHASIFVLIAGSYTPFMLVGLRGGWGWSRFGV
ncbi:MAG: hemolysin III family protein, partial [Bacteroidetes bacterium]|nr:hemolysin III family protein [Bacteroidota bacterium]